jgi:hypothetical protein
MSNALPMAFKGGTSLSKVYDAINRFSEDVDVTIDYRRLDDSVDPSAPTRLHAEQESRAKGPSSAFGRP